MRLGSLVSAETSLNTADTADTADTAIVLNVLFHLEVYTCTVVQFPPILYPFRTHSRHELGKTVSVVWLTPAAQTRAPDAAGVAGARAAASGTHR